MRKVLILLLCCLLLVTCVSADNAAPKAELAATVSSDGGCTVHLTMTLSLTENARDLLYPIPVSAIDVTVNGTVARTRTIGNKRSIELDGIIGAAGMYTLSISYTLPNAVKEGTGGKYILNADLLGGFPYPIDELSYSVTLPGPVKEDPAFTSNYHLDSVESNMTIKVEQNVISGQFVTRLKDQETLNLTLEVDRADYFSDEPQVMGVAYEKLGIAGLSVLALLYWLLTMRAIPPRRMRWTKEPAGITAGEVGCALTGKGVDFTMMVLSWAQMGYILIQLEEDGRVLLHRRMDMGNERNDFEIKYFRQLFGKRKTVDGTGIQYARLCRKAAMFCPNMRHFYERSTGNPVILRLLMAAAGCLGGISLAGGFSPDTAWKTVLSVVLGILAPIAAWLIQEGMQGLHTRHRWRILPAIGLIAAWSLLGFAAGDPAIAITVSLLQALTGLAAAYGGRRTLMGKQLMAQVLGLRRHMKKLGKEEVVQILRRNPEYYYQLAPYAVALQVDKSFARQFGGVALPECSYLTTGLDGQMTAREWNQLLREAVYALDATQQRMFLDTLTGK